MEDQFVWRHGGADTILAGSRKKGSDRRNCRERRERVAKGMFAVHVVDRRHNPDRRRVPDRRNENGAYATIDPSDQARVTGLGFFLPVVGIVAVIFGALVSETVSLSLGLFICMGSIFLILVHIFYPRKPSDNSSRH